MPVTLTFSQPLNVSCQVGDTAFYAPTSTSGGFTNATSASIVNIGVITAISGSTITIQNHLAVPPNSSLQHQMPICLAWVWIYLKVVNNR